MYSITPQSKMASWISILCLPSLDCDTKQTHNKPSLTAQESILSAKTVCCPKPFLLTCTNQGSSDHNLGAQRRLGKVHFSKGRKRFSLQHLLSEAVVVLTSSVWLGQCCSFCFTHEDPEEHYDRSSHGQVLSELGVCTLRLPSRAVPDIHAGHLPGLSCPSQHSDNDFCCQESVGDLDFVLI